MKRQFFLIAAGLMLSAGLSVMAQEKARTDRYVDFNQYLGEMEKGILAARQEGRTPKTIGELRAKAALLVEERAPAEKVRTVMGPSKGLKDEDLFAKRKNGVFIIGKLFGGNGTELRWDLTGTAFAISADGVCVTNYHVLTAIIGPDKNNSDSVYFIVTADRKVYFMEEILAWSQNNDIAVFRVNTMGNRLSAIPLGRPARVGASVFCISHPLGNFYYFSKGMVSRNVSIDSLHAAAGYSSKGRRPVRMEITADYGIGSSGGPVIDRFGNLVGIISTTTTIYGAPNNKADNNVTAPQMVVKDTAPVEALTDLLKK
ncbi:MAG TPA: serine protease [Puia sp.]|uniref:S1 family peptidase n=1 Tax=Puia sp. TaxID=2045100 RepID=UPI002C73AE32|nr:serine protease [Puia sp.]HVU94352.1 serine protease [Puia sp.]